MLWRPSGNTIFELSKENSFYHTTLPVLQTVLSCSNWNICAYTCNMHCRFTLTSISYHILLLELILVHDIVVFCHCVFWDLEDTNYSWFPACICAYICRVHFSIFVTFLYGISMKFTWFAQKVEQCRLFYCTNIKKKQLESFFKREKCSGFVTLLVIVNVSTSQICQNL